MPEPIVIYPVEKDDQGSSEDYKGPDCSIITAILGFAFVLIVAILVLYLKSLGLF